MVSNETCKLLASSIILDYPEPVILGLPGKASPDHVSDTRAKQLEERIFKLVVVLEYLESLPESADQELALVLDAFDIWLLLPPRLLSLRYRAVLRDGDTRLLERGILGVDSAGRAIRSRVILGADQSCWPDETRPYCDQVPDSPLREVSSDEPTKPGSAAHARWANTGVFMGPVKDLRRLFRSTLRLSESGYRTDYPWRFDDQGAVQDIWAEQERHRTKLAGGNSTLSTPDPQGVSKFIRSHDDSAEHGITIDYAGQIVQQAWNSMHAILWTTYGEIKTKLNDPLSDLDGCSPPFGDGIGQTWDQTKIGINLATKHAFPIFHMTAHKSLRQQLWPSMWYHKHGHNALAWKGAKIELWSRDKAETEHKSWEELCTQYQLFDTVMRVKPIAT